MIKTATGDAGGTRLSRPPAPPPGGTRLSRPHPPRSRQARPSRTLPGRDKRDPPAPCPVATSATLPVDEKMKFRVDKFWEGDIIVTFLFYLSS